MTRLSLIIILVLGLGSCNNLDSGKSDSGQTNKNATIKPFEFIVINSDYSSAYAIGYKLTEKELSIVFHGGLVGDKDSIIFRRALQTSDTLLQLSNIDVKNLKEDYTNPCVCDGSQISVAFKKDNIEKYIHLSNYYEENIGKAIELINSLSPPKYKIWYDKKELLEEMTRCK